MNQGPRWGFGEQKTRRSKISCYCPLNECSLLMHASRPIPSGPLYGCNYYLCGRLLSFLFLHSCILVLNCCPFDLRSCPSLFPLSLPPPLTTQPHLLSFVAVLHCLKSSAYFREMPWSVYWSKSPGR
jgi:hypothetical protein